MRCHIIASLIVGDPRKSGRGFDHRLQCERTAGIFEKDARSLKWTGVHVGKAVADSLDQAGFFVQHGSFLMVKKARGDDGRAKFGDRDMAVSAKAVNAVVDNTVSRIDQMVGYHRVEQQRFAFWSVQQFLV